MRKEIPLSSILLYLENPRLSEAETEHDALCKMVQNQQRKLVVLARDIIEYGMSELDLLAVFPDSKKGFYRVAEGNRRVSALKLLQNPDLVIKEYPLISNEFQKMSLKGTIDFDHIDVSVFKSANDPRLIHFLQIRHLGENGGIGTVKWSTEQKERFDYRTFGKENIVIFLDNLEKEGYLTRDQIDGVTQTNWQRIFRPVGLQCLRLKKVGKSYCILDGYEHEFSTKIKLVAKELNGKSVAIVYGENEIKDFFQNIEEKYQIEIEDKTNNPTTIPQNDDTPTDTDDMNKKKQNTGTTPKTETKSNFEKKTNSDKHKEKMPPDPYKNCKTVIPRSIRLQSRNHRINQIILELKSLDVENYPNACGCLLRILIELSAKEYLEHNSKEENYDATKVKFEDAIAQATSRMLQRGQLVNAEANAVKKETSSGGVKLLFNGYMHNTETYPSSIVIKGIFKTYLKFIRECLL